MRAVLVVLLLLVAPVSVHAGQFEALAAGCLAMYAGEVPTPNPAPIPPKPAPSEVCTECNGTGKLGDGTVSVTCPICNGTGKKPIASEQSQPQQKPKPPTTYPARSRRGWFR